MDSLFNLGFLYHHTQGRSEEALDAYNLAAAMAQRLHSDHKLSLIHFRRGDLLKQQGWPDEAFTAYQQGIESIEGLRGATEREDIKIGLLGTTQQLYEAMVLLCLERDRPEEAFDYVERARSRAFLDTLAKKSPELYEAVDQPVATLREVQAALPEGALLLEYFTTGVVPRGEHLLNKVPPENARLREHLLLPPRVWLFAVARDRFEVRQLALDPNSLRPPVGDASPGRRLLHAPQLRLLHERLIAPVAHLLAGRDLLYLVPHGPLHYVPFMALRSGAGGYLLDAEGPAIALAPSATILLRNCLGRPPGRGAGLLALGYNDRGEGALRYAEAEARHLARLAGGRAWAGPEPKGERLLAAGRQPRWLHVAGHAVFNPRDPLDSVLRLGDDDALSARRIIEGLDLEAELVTLSACTTGLSHVVPGDELLGLQRAFLYAGAPTVVCTLWEAHDLVALLVMERFYAALARGTPAAVALRDAQVAMREMTARDVDGAIGRWREEDPEYAAALGEPQVIPSEGDDARPFADPFYWAPFMLIGRPAGHQHASPPRSLAII
ncbi:MAG TPA: CHAT domain-containing tetratricopeptide repeat protein [Vicinamibacteria bacterium]